MSLKPESAVMAGVVTAGLVYAIFQVELPSMADVRHAKEHDPHLKQSIAVASWSAAGAVVGISVLAKDPTIFVIGGTMTAFLAWRAKHANFTSPQTGQIVVPAQDAAPGPAQGS